jgi:hypothetical protein
MVGASSDSACEGDIESPSDINLGLPHFRNSVSEATILLALHTVFIRYSQFDMVHARAIGGGLRDFKKCKEEIEMCLKPGGIMVSHVSKDYMVR